MSKSNRRRIVVEGSTYIWTTSSSCFVLWDANGKRLAMTTPWEVNGAKYPSIFERGQYKQTSDGSVKPFDVANWIRKNILQIPEKPREKPKPTQKLVKTLVPTNANQPNAYIVIGEAGEYEDYSRWIVEIHLDMALALKRTEELNRRENIRQTLCNELYDTLDKAYNDVNFDGLSQDLKNELHEKIKTRFFEKHGLVSDEERDYITKSPSESQMSKYSVCAKPLIDSMEMMVAA